MEKKLLHTFDSPSSSGDNKNQILTFAILILSGALIGAITGAGIYLVKTKKSGKSPQTSLFAKKQKQTAGIKDTKLFPDVAEGILKEGGIDGEGSFHLQRPGGESQNVYLTSSTIDLTQFIGKKVRVWGKTYKGERAGWLMDVGYLEVIE